MKTKQQKDAHLALARLYASEAKYFDDLLTRYTHRSNKRYLGGHPWYSVEAVDVAGPIMSGGFRANFPERTKNVYRMLNRKRMELMDKSYVHWKEAGKRKHWGTMYREMRPLKLARGRSR